MPPSTLTHESLHEARAPYSVVPHPPAHHSEAIRTRWPGFVSSVRPIVGEFAVRVRH
jgi:hypothetical protein